ncbi:MAG: fumarylacetoacetate hydrolase family protein [Hyphomicrobiaceae bacterium]|nr:fumarylacetoacetate hydrolase family protein [Hyphomicrobiaceae bacterium]
MTSTSFSSEAAARFVADAHAARAPYRNLPEAIAPRQLADAYAAQEALAGLWEGRLGPVAGLKIATTTKVMQALMGIDHPCGGMIYASRIHASPAAIRKSDYVNVRIECELAVRLAKDLPGTGKPYTRDDVGAAVGELMAAFELIEDRHAVYKETKALSLIADNAWNGGIVIGAPRPYDGRNPDGIAGSLSRNGKVELTGKTDDPFGALAWLANLAVERGRPIRAGMVVITGSLVVTVDVAPGERLDFAIDGVGEVSMTAR